MIKKIFFYGFLVGFNLLVVEAVSYALYLFKYDNYSLYDIQHSKLDAIDAPTTDAVYKVGEEALDENLKLKNVVHPYFGYVVDGKRQIDGCDNEKLEECFQRVKVHSDRSFPKRDKDKLIVGIFGGSFALGTVKGTGHIDYYKTLLNQTPEFKDKEIIVLLFAAGGYKQPQQLMRLNYLYTLGAEFDVVINLDGFNEMVVSYAGYKFHDVHPIFPQSWDSYMQSALSVELLDAYAEKKSLLSQRASLASVFLFEGIRYSPTMNLIWRMKTATHISSLEAANNKIQSAGNPKSRDFRYQDLGPDYLFTDWQSLYRDAADIWAKSSVLMKAAANVHGSQYFHFLQPNQHIEGSKILSEEERKIAYDPERGYGADYIESHQYLVEKFDYLQENDVSFFDLTYHFKDTPNTLYVDTCCHMNYKGYGLVVTEIINQITPLLVQPKLPE